MTDQIFKFQIQLIIKKKKIKKYLIYYYLFSLNILYQIKKLNALVRLDIAN